MSTTSPKTELSTLHAALKTNGYAADAVGGFTKSGNKVSAPLNTTVARKFNTTTNQLLATLIVDNDPTGLSFAPFL